MGSDKSDGHSLHTDTHTNTWPTASRGSPTLRGLPVDSGLKTKALSPTSPSPQPHQSIYATGQSVLCFVHTCISVPWTVNGIYKCSMYVSCDWIPRDNGGKREVSGLGHSALVITASFPASLFLLLARHTAHLGPGLLVQTVSAPLSIVLYVPGTVLNALNAFYHLCRP